MVRKINKDEIPKVAHMLTTAFKDYEEVTALMDGMSCKEEFTRRFFEAQMSMTYKRGDIFVSEDLNAVCYGQKISDLGMLWHGLMLYFKIAPHFIKFPKEDKKAFRKNSAEHADIDSPLWYRKFVKGKKYYIQIIGVHPDCRGKGLFRQVIQPALDICDRQGLTALIDTHNEKNVSIYKRFGFELVNTDVTKDGKFKRYCLVRKPNTGK